MKPVCTCSTFHFNSSTLFAYQPRFVMVLPSADIFFQNQFVCCCFFLIFFFGNIRRVSSSLDPDHAVGPDLGTNCLQRLSAGDTSK